MGCKGALGKPPSYWRQYVQALIDCLTWLAIPGHQKHSCSKDKVWSWPGVWHLDDTHSEQQLDVLSE